MVLNPSKNDSHRTPSRHFRQPLSYRGLVLEASGREWPGEIQEAGDVDCEVSSSAPFEDIGQEISDPDDKDARPHNSVAKRSYNENKRLSANTQNAVRTHDSINTKLPIQPLQSNDQDEEDLSPANSLSELKTTRKRPHYLSLDDRCQIIEHIAGGGQQSVLAKEIGVTQAAVCHIQKRRFDRPVTQKAGDNADTMERSPSEELFVHEMRTPSVLLLLTTLRDRRSDATSFRRAAGRIIMILIEEALGQIGTCSVEVITSSGHVTTGTERKYDVCGVKLGDEGYPFSVLFHQVEVDAAEGYIHVNSAVDQCGYRYWLLDHMDIPTSISSSKVLLFTATTSNGGRECKAIEALISVGTLEKDITLVTIVCASNGVAAVCSQFPQVRIVTASIDESVDPHSDDIIPGIGDFIARYNGENAYK
ncbi:Hypothetical protein PHPALM_4527 [Phytophthora palmivora]|uniref:Phosphoribosyltransferase domain-containing protein n=1 Tax=Phytophthora palmivora TaxID=4796 RepID=A0A2P4YJL8_9STRA|nr:Hypothetical protein PHPALM_4527 [Phytophthora palmivora]